MTRLSAIARVALVAVLIVLIIVAAGAGYLASSSRTVISTVITPTFTTTQTVSPMVSSRNQNTTTYYNATATSQSMTTSTITPPPVTNFTYPNAEQPPTQIFGNTNFEPPSAILIPANTLVWCNFRLDGISNFTNPQVIVNFYFFPFPGTEGADVTVAIYVNGILNSTSTSPILAHGGAINSSSLIPPSNSANNSIFALTGTTQIVGVTGSTSSVGLNDTIFSFAIFSQSSVWLPGWTQANMAAGSGLQYGESTGQLAGTHEAALPGISLPNSLPNATTTLTFELQISGDLME
jgi:hypothetical protein